MFVLEGIGRIPYTTCSVILSSLLLLSGIALPILSMPSCFSLDTQYVVSVIVLIFYFLS